MQTTPIQNQAVGNPPQMKPAQEGHGCFFWGCMTSLVVVALIGVAAYIGVMRLVGVAKDYTSDQPMKIENVVLPPAQMAALNARIAAFQQALKEDKPAKLALTADEINAKLSSRNDLTAMGLKARIDIEGDKITAAMTMPCPIERFGLKGRHINGKATVRILLQVGRLLVYVDSIEANGKPLPEQFMTGLRSKNLAEKAMEDPETAANISKYKSIMVQNGTIIIEK
jgi:hypothetical protein